MTASCRPTCTASSPPTSRCRRRSRRWRRWPRGAFVVFDEIHHAADDRSWGNAVLQRLRRRGPAAVVVGHAVPLRHLGDPVRRLPPRRGARRLRVRLRRGARRRRCRPPGVLPPDQRVHGVGRSRAATWSAATFEDELPRELANQRLRTALSLEGEWLPTVLDQAHERLLELRRTHPEAGGLIIAMDQEHAQAIAELMARRHRVQAVVAVSDDPDASAQDRPVRRCRTTVDRRGADGVRGRRHPAAARRRVRDHHHDRAVLPPGGRPRRALDARGASPEGVLLHSRRPTTASLRVRAWPSSADTACASGPTTSTSVGARRPRAGCDRRPGDDEQMSLFAVIGSVLAGGVGRSGRCRGAQDDGVFGDDPDGARRTLATTRRRPGPAAAAAARRRASARAMVDHDPSVPGQDHLTLRQRKVALRDANADLARELVRSTGWSHPQVNAELNRLAGIRKISEATLDAARASAGGGPQVAQVHLKQRTWVPLTGTSATRDSAESPLPLNWVTPRRHGAPDSPRILGFGAEPTCSASYALTRICRCVHVSA